MTDSKNIHVALAGNPNSGKTSLFNVLVGSNQKVGNFTGVTVEKYEGFKNYREHSIRFTDLPGTYSLSAYSPEERIARNFILTEKPDLVIHVVDGTNLERNLYLTTQIMDLDIPFVIALNMYDEVEEKQIHMDINYLERLLGAHVVPTSATRKTGITDLLDHIIETHTGEIKFRRHKLQYSQNINDLISGLEDILSRARDLNTDLPYRWLSIKLLENDKEAYKLLKDHPVWISLNQFLTQHLEPFKHLTRNDPETQLTEERYAFIRGALQETVRYPGKRKRDLTDNLDAILINRFTGLPIFALIMYMIFTATFRLGEYPMIWIETFFSWISTVLSNFLPDTLFRSVLVDGIIAGVGGVLVFLPNILILFLGISLLEGTGYMARAAFVVDKIMQRVGLHGKSFIPMLTGFGCSVPAFMATRTLKNEADRITTLLIIPFMSCGAKLPVYTLLIGAFFTTQQAGKVLFGLYVFGILIALASAALFKKTLFRGESEPFVMELPPYRWPSLQSLLLQMWHKARLYIRKAGTVILAASILIWIAGNFPKDENVTQKMDALKTQIREQDLSPYETSRALEKIKAEEEALQFEQSYAAQLGKALEPAIKPLGFDWRIGVALVSGIAAKEVVVSTMGTIYSIGNNMYEESVSLRQRLRNDPAYSPAMGLALMVFVLLYVPCIAATVIFHREAGAFKWTLLYFFYTIGVAWIMAFIVYRFMNFLL
ncbi:TPA: ferrous iron transport protein B [Candidatus Marinimicrobia bacterium]|nr:MAG: Ferrous iron transport protein B [Marinimicrobia bacterium 46_47]KUK90337.1 MAG: ferrous iron transport protein B [Marinimicrobia bacterium 46_43]HAE88231.1 ferrous iron transport protein B [Candidatus Neomarinimicrobiota bacterium]HBY19086.1 ferrous iron transport protein B [Candidatus Neomarinimicrobiota bacterium]